MCSVRDLRKSFCLCNAQTAAPANLSPASCKVSLVISFPVCLIQHFCDSLCHPLSGPTAHTVSLLLLGKFAACSDPQQPQCTGALGRLEMELPFPTLPPSPFMHFRCHSEKNSTLHCFNGKRVF